jgi:hypothetical protein
MIPEAFALSCWAGITNLVTVLPFAALGTAAIRGDLPAAEAAIISSLRGYP